MRFTGKVVLLLTAAALPNRLTYGQAIPEPPVILYGTVLNLHGTTNILWNFGTLRWTFQADSGPPVVVATPLTNINDQFSYVVEVPCESFALGSQFSSNVVRLSVTAGDSAVSYTRSAVVDGSAPALLVSPASTSIILRPRDRGRVERVDLRVSIPLTDSELNGLPDAWERYFFGASGVDPRGDADLDGVSNAEEFAAGTDPRNPDSFLRFVSVTPDPVGGVHVEWSSTLGKFYIMERSTSLISGFTPITSPTEATPPRNSYYDTTATGPDPYFYRIRLDR